jgi:DNA-binding transcriptional LysR family regulator
MRHDAIELRHLRYFVALAEELNFGRAAARCHVSQPPFSVAIRQLESHLGAELVVRRNRRVDLTEAGRAFRDKAVRLLAQAQDAYTLARSVAEGRQGVLRIGFHASMVFRGLDRLVARLAEHEPLLRVVLTELSSQAQIDALLAGQIDIGFGHSAVVPSQLSFATLFDEPLVACLPPRHPAAATRHGEPLDLRRLAHEAFILFRRAGSPAYFDQIVALCMAAGFAPEVRFQVSQWLTVVSMVAKGMGVAIVPQCLAGSGLGARFMPLASEASSPVQCMWARPPNGR